jgi:hypothetical protein
LKNKAHVHRQIFFDFRQDPGGAQGNGHMAVVAAGVHETRPFRFPRWVCGFGDGQGIDVGAPGHSFFGPGNKQVGHHIGTQVRPMKFQAQGFQFASNDGGGFRFFKGHFGILVKEPPQAAGLRRGTHQFF